MSSNNNNNRWWAKTDDDEEHKHPSSSSADVHPDPSSRRPRGRPAGSKNRPKPPIILNRDSPNSLRTHLLHISPGSDISSALSHFSHLRRRGLSILTASGTVANVTLRQPSTPPAILHGCFEILSLSGSFFPSPSHPSISSLAVYLSAGQGQVIGGSVVGSLIAAGPVLILAAIFANVTLEHLPLSDDNNNNSNDDPPPAPASGDLHSPPLPFINNLLHNNNNNNMQLGHESSSSFPWPQQQQHPKPGPF